VTAASKTLEAELVQWRKFLAELREEMLEGKKRAECRRVSQPPLGRFPALTLVRGGRDAG